VVILNRGMAPATSLYGPVANVAPAVAVILSCVIYFIRVIFTRNQNVHNLTLPRTKKYVYLGSSGSEIQLGNRKSWLKSLVSYLTPFRQRRESTLKYVTDVSSA